MKEDENGQETPQGAQRECQPQESEMLPVVPDVDTSAYEAQIAERDGRIAELEA